MKRIKIDYWLPTQEPCPAPQKIGAGQQVMAAWTPIDYQLPDGAWVVDWQVMGGMQNMCRYDVAVVQLAAPNFDGQTVQSCKLYASATTGRSIIFGPAMFWIKQSSINAILIDGTARTAGLKFVAQELSPGGVAGITIESCISVCSAVQQIEPIEVYPYGPVNLPWGSERFQLMAGRWYTNSPLDVMRIYRYEYTTPTASPTGKTLIATVQPESIPPININQCDGNPNYRSWGSVEMAGSSVLTNLVLRWEKCA